MSYQALFKVYGDDKYYANTVRFATAEEADQHGRSKQAAWTLCEAYRVETSDDPVNYVWDPTASRGLRPVSW